MYTYPMEPEEFAAALAALRGDEAPETIYDDLTKTYSNVFSASDSAAAKVAAQEAELERQREVINSLKSKNFDLLMEVGTKEPTKGVEEDESPAINDFEDMFNFTRKVR